MKIAPNTVVTLTYELYIGDNSDEENDEETFEIAEVVGEDEPMVFLHSKSGLPETFEQNLTGLTAGETFDFWLAPETGYGEYNEEANAQLPLAMFKDELGEEYKELLEVGNMVPFTDDDGSQLNGQIIEITDELVHIDFNHPLAGRAMHFTGEVISVREATTEELEHGHVHGPGGVEH